MCIIGISIRGLFKKLQIFKILQEFDFLDQFSGIFDVQENI
jgi:hypothetical protein